MTWWPLGHATQKLPLVRPVASRPCNTFMTTTRQTGTISPSQSSGEAGRPGLPRRHRHHPFRSHAALGDRAAPAGLRNSAVCVAPLASLADIRRLAWGCSQEERSRLYSKINHPLCTISGGAPLGSSDNKINHSPKTKKHTLNHLNQQELSCVHHARSAAAHGLPATPGAGVDEQRQPAA